MARKPRVQYAGAVYHVLCRGDRKQATCIHLNPARAGLLARKSTTLPLESYAWSSYPAFLKPPSRRPPWLRVDRVLAELALPDTAAGRRRYAEYVTKRAHEEILGEQADDWRPIRHG